MYPRNAASPERIAIGPVVQISDGAVQTSGVAVKVIPFGSTEASGTGTVAYSADGVVLYTPVQGETNYTSFVLVASKSGCIPATQTIVTTAESTAGRVAANVTHFGDTAGTFSSGRPEVNTTHWGGTAVGLATINCNMTQISGDTTAADNAESFFDGTGYAGTNNVIPTVTTLTTKTGFYLASGGLAAVTTWTVDITGSLSGSVGSVSGAVGSVTGNVGGSVASIASGGITSSSFATDSITATVLAASAISEIQSGLATAANQVIIIDGIGYLLAQETGSATSPQTSAPVYATAFNGSTYTVTHTGVDATGVRGTATRAKT